MSESTTNAPTSVSRGRRVLLIVSLCLNVALVVTIVVAFAIGFRQGFHHMPFSAREFLAQASGDERASIQRVVDVHRDKMKVLRKASMDAHRRALELFEEATFNKNDMASALDRMHMADDAVRAEATRESIDSMALLSPEERKTIGEKMRRRARWWGWLQHRQ
jgi:uncharacterized membrane protein